MRGSLVECSDLLALTGYEKPGDAARCLRKQGIRVFDGKNGIWTTLELINAAGGIIPAQPEDGFLKPDDVL